MKILMYGAGVIGSLYGWQLAKAGHQITVLVREERMEAVKKEGIPLVCRDFRGGRPVVVQTVFRPDVVSRFPDRHSFEYIIVTTNRLQLPSVLPVLKRGAGDAHILFFQNSWDVFDEIARYLAPEQYFFGFPFMAGGGRDSSGRIEGVISGLKYSCTPLGETDGGISARVRKMAEALEKVGLKPFLSDRILLWLVTHYVIAAALSAGIVGAGSAAGFVDNSYRVRTAIGAVREGFAVCRKRGFNANTEKANILYRLPLLLAVPIARKIYANQALQLMFDRHVSHAPDEIRQMTEDIIADGVRYKVRMPCLKKLRDCWGENQ